MDNLENKGWNAMHNILDKEMPVEKKKRRGLIYWWIGSAAAVVILLIGVSQFNNSPKGLSPIAVETIPSDPVDSNNNKVIERGTEYSKSELNNSVITEQPNSKADIQIPKAITREKIKSNISYSDENNHTTISSESHNSINLKTGNENKLDIDQSLSSVTTDKDIFHIPIIELTDIRTLSLAPINKESDLLIAPRILTKKPLIRNCFLELEHSRPSQNNYSTFNLRLNRSFVFNNRIDFKIGLGYSYRPRVYSSTSVASTAQDAINSGNGQFSAISSNGQNLIKTKLHGLTIQTGISYNITPRLSADLDAELSYLTVSNEKLGAVLQLFVDPGSPAGIGASTYRPAYRGKMGLTYNLSSRLSLSGGYSYLLNNRQVYSDNLPDFYTDEIGISMQYMLD